jgi:phosphate transport system protein
MSGELRAGHREHLVQLEDRVLAMGDRVLDMMTQAMDALERRDQELGRAVIAMDDALDHEYAAVQDGILTTLALQAPVASELRLVAALLHVNVHLERMGDVCVNIAKFVKLLADFPGEDELLRQIHEMGEHGKRVARRALEAFSARDLEAAYELPAMDDPLDQLNKGLFRRLVALAASDETRLDWAMRMVLVARNLERFGDHAVDIGEQAVFAVTGSMVELSSNSPTPRDD